MADAPVEIELKFAVPAGRVAETMARIDGGGDGGAEIDVAETQNQIARLQHQPMNVVAIADFRSSEIGIRGPKRSRNAPGSPRRSRA